MNQVYQVRPSFVKLPVIDVSFDVPALSPAGCKRCGGPLGDPTRRHCGPCILSSLMRWKSLGGLQ